MGNTSSGNQQRNAAPPPRPQRPAQRQNNPPLNISPNSGADATAGAYRMPGQTRNNRYYVTIPRGVRPGQHFAVLVNGTQMMVRLALGVRTICLLNNLFLTVCLILCIQNTIKILVSVHSIQVYDLICGLTKVGSF